MGLHGELGNVKGMRRYSVCLTDGLNVADCFTREACMGLIPGCKTDGGFKNINEMSKQGFLELSPLNLIIVVFLFACLFTEPFTSHMLPLNHTHRNFHPIFRLFVRHFPFLCVLLLFFSPFFYFLCHPAHGSRALNGLVIPVRWIHCCF